MKADLQRPRGPLAWAALVLAATLTACRSADVATANLDELLDDDDRLRYTGAVQTGWQFFWQGFIPPGWLTEDSPLRSDEVVPIPDPAGMALKNLLALRKGTFSSDRWLHAEQVRQYVRYAVDCPASLCRERAFLELADHALRLGPLETVREPEPPASPAEISEALKGLVQALNAMLEGGGEVSETRRTDFEAACALCERLNLDVDGGWRLLKVVARFGEVSRVPADELQPLFRLSTAVQRDLVGSALARGRHDPHPRVRAAAWRANEAAFGRRFLAEALLAIPLPEMDPDGRRPTTLLFGLEGEWRGEHEPSLAVLELVREKGLPIPRDLDSLEKMRLRYRELFTLVQIAHDFIAHSDRVRTAAMLTLGRVSGADFTSLRKEDWDVWWEDHRRVEGRRLEEALRASPESRS